MLCARQGDSVSKEGDPGTHSVYFNFPFMATLVYYLHVYILLYGQRLFMVIWQYENPTSERNGHTS